MASPGHPHGTVPPPADINGRWPEVSYTYEQPGLQIEQPQKEVYFGNSYHDGYYYNGYHSGELTANKPYSPSAAAYTTTVHPDSSVSKTGRNRLKWWLLLGAVVLLLIIAGVVAGVVVGLRSRNGDGNSGNADGADGSSSPPNPSATATPLPGRINSGLTVTGWRNDDEFSIRLISQANNSYMQMSQYNSTTGKWTEPYQFQQAEEGTSMGISSFDFNSFFSEDPYKKDPNPGAQIELFYIDDSNIRECVFNNDENECRTGSIDSKEFTTGEFSRIASYWPSIVFHDRTGHTGEIVHNYTVPNDDGNWVQIANPNPPSPRSAKHATIVEIPTNPGFDGYSMTSFYETSENALLEYGRTPSLGGWGKAADSSIRKVRTNAPIGAFAVPDRADADRMNHYVLWQDKTGTIQMVSRTGSDGAWSKPGSAEALAGAEFGTDIACLTPSAWPSSNLQPKFDMSRCYFWADGKVREVLYDGSDWSVLGNVLSA